MSTRIHVARARRRLDARRRALAQHLAPSRAAETAYVADLRRILAQVHAGVLHVVAREGLIPGRDARQDAPRARIGLGSALVDKIVRYVGPETAKAFDRMAASADKQAAKGLRKAGLIAVTPRAAGIDPLLARARDANIRLVEKAGRAYAQDVRDVIGDEANFGKRPEEIAALLEARGNVSASRAALIAKDQTLKLSGALVEARARAAGVHSYTWSTSLDERVRPMHAALEGRTFTFDDPPITEKDGERNNPGGAVLCRCVAVPVLEDYGELDEPPAGDEGIDVAAE